MKKISDSAMEIIGGCTVMMLIAGSIAGLITYAIMHPNHTNKPKIYTDEIIITKSINMEVVYYKDLEIVCMFNKSNLVNVFCWGIENSPEKIKELVNK